MTWRGHMRFKSLLDRQGNWSWCVQLSICTCMFAVCKHTPFLKIRLAIKNSCIAQSTCALLKVYRQHLLATQSWGKWYGMEGTGYTIFLANGLGLHAVRVPFANTAHSSYRYGVSWPSGLAYRTQVLVLTAECGFESRPWHLCPWARHLIIIASLHPGVKWVPVRAELVD